MTAVLVAYAAIAAGTWPMFSRCRYRKVVAGHPQTHERDVRRDAGVALAQGALRALLWLPIAASRVARWAVWPIARMVVGRRTLRRDLSAAHGARMNAELAVLDAQEHAEVIDIDRQRRRDQVRTLRSLMIEAEQIKRSVVMAERLGVDAAEQLAKLARVKEQLAVMAFEYEHDRMRVAR